MDLKELLNFRENFLFLIISLVSGFLGIIVFTKVSGSLVIGILIGILFFISSYIYWIRKGKKKR